MIDALSHPLVTAVDATPGHPPARAPRVPAAMRRLLGHALSVPLLGKLAGANLVIVLAAFVSVSVERQLHLPGRAVSILGIALAVSLSVNLVLVYIALRPLSDLEAAAARVSAGDMAARVPASVVADRDMTRIGTTLNALLDRLTEDRARVRGLAAQVISAQDEERARLARELHDSTAQILTAVMLQLSAAARESTSPALDARIVTLRALTADALEEVRSMPHMMHPRVLDDLGLVAALEWLARQTAVQEGLDVHVVADAEPVVMSAPLASVLYRVAQEALRNVIRHAAATQVDVVLRRAAGEATLEIADNGRGFDVRGAEERRPGMGLFSMRERVALVNGTLAVSSTARRGTRVVATVPLAS